jgi:hypothetical protein
MEAFNIWLETASQVLEKKDPHYVYYPDVVCLDVNQLLFACEKILRDSREHIDVDIPRRDQMLQLTSYTAYQIITEESWKKVDAKSKVGLQYICSALIYIIS